MVLPHVSTFAFDIETTSVLYYATLIFSSSQLTKPYKAITKVSFPGFYQFSGVQHNRLHNPFLKMAAQLPSLKELTFTMHTAGTTTSALGERQMITLESTDPERARERVNMSLEEVVRRYELHGLFGCRGLRRVCIEYIDCQRTASFTGISHPVNLIRQIHTFLINGFALNGIHVVVELVRVA
ncbi:hypothetical protein BDU57DRAFT_547735 [Ampelomyces quisqualis]|uniref:Uncharacterized protein n=1 Tax=Ampelomyces quisqualis TaxID=50730 RepID=A0A6A5QMC0_AMPQU|nr:hypothetical protein BDU57DRAFT_547735 [Ampelomyces quisqualis]